MIRNLLTQLRRRRAIQLFLDTWAKAAVAAVLLAGLGVWLSSGSAAWWLAGAVAGSAAAAALWSLYRRPTLAEVAAMIDRKAATRDRLSTALAFEALGQRTPLHDAALAECEAALRDFEPQRWTPWRLPRETPWLAVALGGVLLAVWLPRHFAPPVLPPDAAAVATAERLEQLANTLEKEKTEEDQLAEVVEAIRQSASRLRAEATTVDAQKAALRELSGLEAMLEAAQQASQEEALAQLGEALAESEATREAGKALEKGDAEGAAEKLDQAAREWDEKKQQEEALAKAMQQLAQQLGGSQLGSAAQEMASALRQQPQGQRGSAGEALQKLAEAVRQAEAASRSGQAGNEKLQKMARAMQEMKTGQGQGQPGRNSAEGEGEAGVMMVEAPGGGAPKAAAPGSGDGSTGSPGSELDQGTKPNALGATAVPDPVEPELSAQLQGLLGEGETLQSLIATASGEAAAKRGYQAIYEAALPAAQEAVNQEKIPLGSRLLVKRYFESIRPKP
ncbi:MAG TPA: hypothetical protein VNQ90_11590 [Chthoniobacteraceae bacterium]|nr:hypothetical protein [Chthoniobacteraceae bacterium]